MGVVTAEVVLLSPQAPANGRQQTETLQAIVDTGATLSVFPAPTLENLAVPRVSAVSIRLGDGRRIERAVGDVEMRIDGQALWARVIFGEPSDPIVLGLTALETLGLTVDPVARRLVPAEFLLLALGRATGYRRQALAR